MIGYGTQFLRSADQGANYVQILKLLDLEEGERSRGSAENTPIDGTDHYKTFEPTIIDPGETSLTFIWDEVDAGQVLLQGDFHSQTIEWYQVLYTDGTSVSFRGFPTGWGKSVTIEDKITRTVKFKISGKPVIVTV